jgi:hypothetical protein
MTDVYVAVVNTYWEITAVAETEVEAIRRAGELAYKYLKHEDAIDYHTDSVAKCIEYFDINVTRVPVGSAVFTHNEKVLPCEST